MVKSDLEISTGIVADLSEKKPIRVLHVDDESALLKIESECLRMEGPLTLKLGQNQTSLGVPLIRTCVLKLGIISSIIVNSFRRRVLLLECGERG